MRVQRVLSAVLITMALPALVWAQTTLPFEMLSITSGAAVGITVGLCGPAANPGGAIIQILDQPVYHTLHGPNATPSALLGGLLPTTSIVTVPRASDFKAIAVSTTARAYVVCVPR